MSKARVLFVDDEPSLVLTMPRILGEHGYEVAAVSSVNEALSQIVSSPFDVLISDLNIGEPGDGFVVVSAMRRTQPSCVTLILTGYPGFDSALEAIRSQVDDYLVKPTPVPTLIETIEQLLKSPKSSKAPPTKRLAELLRECTFEITQRALQEMKDDPVLGGIPLSDAERIEFVPRTIDELAELLESHEPARMAETIAESGEMRGPKRYQQGYTIPLLATHTRLVESAIYDVIHERLLTLNLSNLMAELKQLNICFGVQLEFTLKAYLEAERKNHRRARRQV